MTFLLSVELFSKVDELLLVFSKVDELLLVICVKLLLILSLGLKAVLYFLLYLDLFLYCCHSCYQLILRLNFDLLLTCYHQQKNKKQKIVL